MPSPGVAAELRGHIVLVDFWTLTCISFHARDLHLVTEPAVRDTSMRSRVLIDGQPPGAAHGADVDSQDHGTVAGQRLHQFIRQHGPSTDRTFEITFPGPEV